MNRKVKRVLFIGAFAFGISAMIPQDVSAQLFRGRRGSTRHCSPVRYSASVDQGACCGQSNMVYGSAAYASSQPTMCCETISNSGSYNPQVHGATLQNGQERYDAAGNRVEDGTTWHGQDRIDSQWNRNNGGTQWSGQQRNVNQGNLIDERNQVHGQRPLDGRGSRNAAGS